MKTNKLHKISAVMFMMFVFAITAGNPAFAQRRTREYHPEKRENSKGKNEKRDHQSNKARNDRNQRDNDDRFERNDRNQNRDYSYRAPRDDRRDYDRNWNKRRPVYESHPYYRIPRYNGRVRVYARAPWGIQHHPVIIRHQHGNIYCFGGNFYTYYRNYGYVQIELPRDIVFTTIPREAVRVRVDGRLMFRLGNVYFELGSGGYHIINYRAYPEVYGYVDRY